MKTRFNTFDILCSVTELQRLIGMRVQNIYDVDSKTYLIKLQKGEEKAVLLLESGNRIHSTSFEWPKGVAPSGFSMKMRKHLKNKRLESLEQVGVDRIIDLRFGSNEAAYHLILELFDRGNLILLDYQMTILYVLRPHTEGEEIRFAVREKYPSERARLFACPPMEEIRDIISKSNPKDGLKRILNPHVEYGPAIIEHVVSKVGFKPNEPFLKRYDLDKEFDKIQKALEEAEEIFKMGREGKTKGYIIQKQEERPSPDGPPQFFLSNQEFHPMIFTQHSSVPHKEFPTFDEAVDEFFSSLEGQKIDLKAVQQEREAMKKLENVRKDHVKRLGALHEIQIVDRWKAELISRNQTIVDRAIEMVNALLAKQLPWPEIEKILKEQGQDGNDPVAAMITGTKFEKGFITMHLTDPYAEEGVENVMNEEEWEEGDYVKPMSVDVYLKMTAFANSRRYYDQKKHAAKKQQKTIDAQSKALKSAERKTKQALKEVQTITNISKARKVYWFEKFFWFISSENYLVIGGRDQQQNELLVKRYMKSNDVYVHADMHGASSVIIKNNTDQPIPPKTLNEAGTMAICYSVAWEAKVVTNAWWVRPEQVSKSAPTGEYLGTGSFMIRGKKNYLPPCHLIMGFGFMFRLEDDSVERHRGERRVRTEAEEEQDTVTAASGGPKGDEDVELEIIEESGEEDSDEEKADSEDDDKSNFPNTKIKIQHFSGTKINILTETPVLKERDENEDNVIYLGDDKPVVLKPSGQRSRQPSETKSVRINVNENKGDKKTDTANNQNQIKRGQKSKLKKIKEKYKDQDEEERQLRMQIIQSAGSDKKDKKSKAKGKEQSSKREPKKPGPKPQVNVMPNEDDDEEVQVTADIDMIDSLTGQPVAEDELLFAVPVVAPYNTLTNYKFKVKLTPGTSKRGKAARTALSMYLRDKNTTQREKDLLRSVKDEQLARNLPGKVKLSAPKMQVGKK